MEKTTAKKKKKKKQGRDRARRVAKLYIAAQAFIIMKYSNIAAPRETRGFQTQEKRKLQLLH